METRVEREGRRPSAAAASPDRVPFGPIGRYAPPPASAVATSTDDVAMLPGRAQRIAELIHRLAQQGAELEHLVDVLIVEGQASMELLTAVLHHCSEQARVDVMWRRSVTAVQATMGTGRLRWT
jgi:hypothetical protein